MNDDIITFEAPEPADLSELFPGYEVSSLIAQGGMGAVYHAIQISLERPVAIKLLPKEFGDESFKEQFAAEARAMAKLNHPNLIGIYDFGEVEGMPFIVMEYVEGKSLYYSCYQKAIEQTEAVRIVSEICQGLAHAHENGIIHRDIKPANILLDSHAHAKIGDFGLASPSDQDDEGIVYGTPGYAAPEIMTGEGALGTSSDLYAVGVILHELLTGKLPIDDPRPPSRLTKCHPQLDRVVRKATRVKPEARYSNALEIVEDLGKIPALRSLKTESVEAKKILLPETPEAQKPAVARTFTPAIPDTKESEGSAAAPVVVAIQPSTNWPLIRNLMIIALLIPALIFAWGKYQDKEKERESVIAEQKKEENASQALQKAKAQQQRKELEERSRRAALAKQKEKEDAEKFAATVHEQPKKTPLEELADLRGELRGGARSAFPKGTLKRGTDYFFLIEEPMTWGAACQFAEAHGGHLATPLGESDISWIGENQGDHRRVWIGGGAVGQNDWGWVTGKEWKHKKPLTNLGSCAALTRTGVLGARPNGEKLPFFIQWTADGVNSGGLEAQLERLKGTLGAPTPAWPPGTIFLQGRSYLLIHRSVSWDEADLIAGASGGHLAVSSDVVEKDFLREKLTSGLGKNEAAWLGGRRTNDGNWLWVTGEVWDQPDWATNSPDGNARDSALRFLSDGDASGWDDSRPNDASLAQSFMIEWSLDYKKAPAQVDGGGDAGAQEDAIVKLRIVGARYLGKQISENGKRTDSNRKRLIWDINSWIRNLPKSQHDRFIAKVNAIRQALPASGKIPANLNVGGLPSEAVTIFQKALERQNRFDQTLEQDISKFRTNYLSKLLAARKQAEDAGFKEKLPAFDQEIEALGQSVADFRDHFAMGEE
ncbi:MAG: protein kinase domain-containing protein [Akkermansiaceae bacterium]